MTCGCSSDPTPLMMGGAKKKRSSTTRKRSSTTRKRSSTTMKKRKSTTMKKRKSTTKRKMRGGNKTGNEYLDGTSIPLRVQSNPGWKLPGETGASKFAIDTGSAMQSYLFGRPTPDSKNFLVASGLVQKGPNEIEMVAGLPSQTGGAKKKRKTTTKKKKTTTKKKKTTTKKKKTTTKKKKTIKK